MTTGDRKSNQGTINLGMIASTKYAMAATAIKVNRMILNVFIRHCLLGKLHPGG